jgi:hypothetical protein
MAPLPYKHQTHWLVLKRLPVAGSEAPNDKARHVRRIGRSDLFQAGADIRNLA